MISARQTLVRGELERRAKREEDARRAWKCRDKIRETVRNSVRNSLRYDIRLFPRQAPSRDDIPRCSRGGRILRYILCSSVDVSGKAFLAVLWDDDSDTDDVVTVRRGIHVLLETRSNAERREISGEFGAV